MDTYMPEEPLLNLVSRLYSSEGQR
jgi:hypothetical protein